MSSVKLGRGLSGVNRTRGQLSFESGTKALLLIVVAKSVSFAPLQRTCVMESESICAATGSLST